MDAAVKTHVGHLRHVNEDSGEFISISDSMHLAVVADGMGGHQAGDTASQMTLDTLRQAIDEIDSVTEMEDWEAWLSHSIQQANERIFTYAQENPVYQGMGTTVVAVLFLEEYYIIAHVGDSRVYKYADEQLLVLTEDHSLVQELVQSGQISEAEAKIHPQRNVITRALGTESEIAVDTERLTYSGDEQILLCSDGLTGMITEEQMVDVLRSELDVQQKASSLLQQALDAGGEDNVTLILIQTRRGGDHVAK